MKRTIAWCLIVGYGLFVWWFTTNLQSAGESIEKSWQEMAKPSPVPAAIIIINDSQKGLKVPSWKWLNTGMLWAYASPKSKPINPNFKPELKKLTISHGDWIGDNRVDWRVLKPLENMDKAAKRDGVNILVTNAHRSIDSQKQLQQESIAKYGAEWASKHLTEPGNSEHHLGLAVDLTTFSPACRSSFDSCTISTETANWLISNAQKFGFILRYPPGKEDETGISHEPWHYRYVGVDMAKIVTEADLTYDEIYHQLEKARQ